MQWISGTTPYHYLNCMVTFQKLSFLTKTIQRFPTFHAMFCIGWSGQPFSPRWLPWLETNRLGCCPLQTSHCFIRSANYSSVQSVRISGGCDGHSRVLQCDWAGHGTLCDLLGSMPWSANYSSVRSVRISGGCDGLSCVLQCDGAGHGTLCDLLGSMPWSANYSSMRSVRISGGCDGLRKYFRGDRCHSAELASAVGCSSCASSQDSASQDVMVEVPSGEWRHDVKLFLACIASAARLEWLFAEISAFCVVTQDIGLLITFILSCYIYAL